MSIRSSYARLSRIARAGIIVGILLILYGIFGFLISPLIVKSLIISDLSQTLGIQANLYQVKINPFALSVTMKGFEVSAPDNGRFAGFEELYVNFQLSSIFRRAYTFSEIRLTAPYGHIKILPDGSLSLSRVFAQADSSADSSEVEAASPSQEAGMPPVFIYRLKIDKGRLDFSDLSRPTPFESTLSPIRVELTNFGTRRDSHSPYAFSAALGNYGSLGWEGNVSINPIRSSGRVELTGIKVPYLWKYIRDQAHFEVTSGSMDLNGRYDAEAGSGPIRIRVSDGGLRLAGLKISETGSSDTLVSVPTFSVKGINIDLNNRRVVVASVTSSDAQLGTWLAPDGTFKYQTLFAMDGFKRKGVKSSGPPNKSEAKSTPWLVTVDEVTLENYGIAFEDRRQPTPVCVDFGAICANLRNLSNQKDSPVNVTLALKINQTGTIGVKGTVTPIPPKADLDVQAANVDLKLFQSYVESVAQLDLMSGDASVEGRATYRGADPKAPKLCYQGKVNINGFRAVDHAYSEDLFKWESLAFDGVTFTVKPTNLNISDIVAKEPYVKVIIHPDRTTNLSCVFSRKDGQTSKDAGLGAKAQEKAPMPITINMVRVDNGSGYFADLSLKPNFFAGIQTLNGTIKGLSSKSGTRADIKLEGTVDKYAPVKISGQINPLSKDVYTDLAVTFKNFELTSLTPYSAKFAGYAIEKGKLSLDLKYKLSGSVLTGENKIVLDQLSLGERVDSPDATKLPIGLAIASLKDRNGIIDIYLPVQGDLNDPQFSFGRTIFQALVRLITKAATSPFALLGNLIGGNHQELSYIEFNFGSAELRTDQAAKLDTLAKALAERPTLRLEIKGTANSQSDWPALVEATLLNQMKRTRFEELREGKAPAPDRAEDISLSEDDYDRLLTQVYVNAFQKKPEAIFGAEPTASAEGEQAIPDAAKSSRKSGKPKAVDRAVILAAAKQRLIENTPLDHEALQRLAHERASQIKDYLVQKGQIRDERVFMIEPEVTDAAEGSAVRVILTLSAG